MKIKILALCLILVSLCGCSDKKESVQILADGEMTETVKDSVEGDK